VVFDEWSQIPKGVEKELKSLTTGGTFKTRELYTTSTVVELSCDAAVMMTTNANPTREVANSRRLDGFPHNELVLLRVVRHILEGMKCPRCGKTMTVKGETVYWMRDARSSVNAAIQSDLCRRRRNDS
jgi:hypothetical protein